MGAAATVRRELRSYGLVEGSISLADRALMKALATVDRRSDRRLGTETSVHADVSELSVTTGHRSDGFAYVPSPSLLIRALACALRIAPERHVFVDVGSGKGRVLLRAARSGYRRAIGVEYASELHEAAQRNVARALPAQPSARRIELHHGDAATFDFPAEPAIVYLSNPFNERVMAAVLANLQGSLADRPRSLTLVYQEARHEDDPTTNLELLAATPWLRARPLRFDPLDRILLHGYRIRAFESRPGSDPVTGGLPRPSLAASAWGAAGP